MRAQKPTPSYNATEWNAMQSTAEQQGPRLQQIQIYSNTTAVITNIKERSYLPSEGLRYIGISSRIPLPSLPTLK